MTVRGRVALRLRWRHTDPGVHWLTLPSPQSHEAGRAARPPPSALCPPRGLGLLHEVFPGSWVSGGPGTPTTVAKTWGSGLRPGAGGSSAASRGRSAWGRSTTSAGKPASSPSSPSSVPVPAEHSCLGHSLWLPRGPGRPPGWAGQVWAGLPSFPEAPRDVHSWLVSFWNCPHPWAQGPFRHLPGQQPGVRPPSRLPAPSCLLSF